ncbi:MAG: carboxymuconolactone decarboxylase family protein [Chlorobiaceae bacterium]|nr:carboxymuconolactone decarboxylase family protein [Chlorobiaceae bacterium]
MIQAFEQMIFRNLTPLSIRHLQPPDIGRATGLSAAVYRQLEQEFQAVPPITMHHLNPQLMAGVWSACRESLIAGPDRALKEAVAVSVSRSNRCPYCVQAHTSMLRGSGDMSALRAAEGSSEGPEAFSEVVAWAAATGTPFPKPSVLPFSEEKAPAVMATAVLFHYINRVVNIFLDDTMMPIVGKVPVIGEQAFRIFSSVVSGRIVTVEVAPGVFLTEAPDTPLPEAFGWASGDADVSGGLHRFAAAAIAAAADSVDAGVQELVRDRVAGWKGEPQGPGKGWVDRAVSVLPEQKRPQARMALLSAIASWAVDDAEVAAFRQTGLGDRELLDTAAWGAYLAAERVAGWIAS